MSSQSREVINQALIGAIHEGGAICVSVPNLEAHPRRHIVVRDGMETSLWTYCWSLTPGGRPSLPDEYRIQMTSVASPLTHNPDGRTVLLGYDQNLRVFAGFDIARHSVFTSGSPSVQVNRSTLNEAIQNGLSLQTKSNGEIVVGIRSDLLLFYIENAPEIHGFDESKGEVEIMTNAIGLQNTRILETASLDSKRQRVVSETARWTRSASFRKQVLLAYDHRCAVTRHQLNLVEAAHILPVSAGNQSIDSVRNGLALSPTYHRAFDKGLIYVDADMVMRLNRDAADELRGRSLDGGLDEFASHLGPIHLPLTAELRPDPHFIGLANSYRGLDV